MFPTRSLHAANILCSYAYRLGCVIFCQPGNIYIVKRHIKYLPISLHWITETVQLARNKSCTRAFAAFTCMQLDMQKSNHICGNQGQLEWGWGVRNKIHSFIQKTKNQFLSEDTETVGHSAVIMMEQHIPYLLTSKQQCKYFHWVLEIYHDLPRLGTNM